MGVKIPTFEDVGTVDPRAVGGVPSYPQEDPAATALQQFGGGVQKAGQAALTVDAYQHMARNRMDRAMADANFFSSVGQIDAELKAETDPAKITALGQQYSQAAQTAGGVFSDPGAREMWLAEQQRHVAVGQKGADLRNLGLWRDNYKAGIMAQGEAAIGTASKVGTPEAFELARQRVADLAGSAKDAGAMSAVEALEFQDRGNKLLEHGSTGARVGGAAMRALGVASAPPVGGMSAGGGISQRISEISDIPPLRPVPPEYAPIVEKAAMQYGVPPELLARTIHSESSFNPNAVSPTGARGIAQFITSTANQYGVDRSDPTSSIMGAAHYLSDLHQQKGSWQAALHGYLGSDPWQDKSYTSNGAIQLASVLDKGVSPELTSAAAPSTSGSGSIVAFGDSIAAHLVRKAGAGGQESGKVGVFNPGDTAVSGWTPTQILQAIAKAPDDSIRGKNVVLSTGASNNPSQLDFVPEQIKAFKERGAASVTVMGVGTADRVAGVNDKLAQIATQNGASFAGPLRNVASDGIHSSDPKAELAAVRQAIPAAQTGQQAQPAAAPNRTGLPMPPDVMRQIMNDPTLHNDQERMQAFAHAEQVYRINEAAAAQQERIATQQSQAQMRQAENEVFADVYSGTPKITPQQVAVDPRFSADPMRRKQMIELINNPPGSGVPAAQSYNAALSLIDRIRLPDGDPNKITDIGQIYDQMRSLNRSDFEFVRKEFDNVRTPGGELFAKRKADFVKAIAPQIDKSNPIMGQIDQSGKEQLYGFEWALDQKIEEYRKAGKNPRDLLDPSKPDYMGKPEAVAPYQKTLQQSLKDQVNTLTGGPSQRGSAVGRYGEPVATAPIPPASATVPTAPNPFVKDVTPGVVPRLPGETPGDYMKRIGGGLPAMPGAR